ncbi:hypothetical protein AN958_03870 [Leucoagaricus sp. SymC.cos]|nr:hypothetical protein AN958_03870 [Leucoagaricus sp. SymC.cos]
MAFSSHHPELSLFQQTVREKDEEFYKTFPAAHLAALQQQDPHAQIWRPELNHGECLPGYGFQLDTVDSLHYSYLSAHDHIQPQPFSQSSLSDAVEPSSLVYQQAPLHSEHHAAYATPRGSPPQLDNESFLSATPLPPHITPSALDIPHQHQYLPSPVTDSLPSPDTSSDPATSFHTSYQSISPSSPIHQEPLAPLSPPAMAQAYTRDLNAVRNEYEQQPFFVDQQAPPPNTSSGGSRPSRRKSRDASSRSQHRHSPPYPRPHSLTHRSGGSRSSSTNMAWTPSPPTATSSMVMHSSVGAGTFLHTAGTPQAPAPVIVPQSSSPPALSGKRNPEKKPALACVFCRGRKIACGPPSKDGDGKTCNQCERRSLRCEYPTESRRGMRKKPSSSNTPGSPSTPTSGTPKSTNNVNATSSLKLNTDPETPKTATNKKR